MIKSLHCKGILFLLFGVISLKVNSQEISSMIGVEQNPLVGILCSTLQNAVELHEMLARVESSPTPQTITRLPNGCSAFQGRYTPLRIEPSLRPLNLWTKFLDDRGPQECRIHFPNNGPIVSSRCRDQRATAQFVLGRSPEGVEAYVLLGRPSLPDQYVARHGRVP